MAVVLQSPHLFEKYLTCFLFARSRPGRRVPLSNATKEPKCIFSAPLRAADAPLEREGCGVGLTVLLNKTLSGTTDGGVRRYRVEKTDSCSASHSFHRFIW